MALALLEAFIQLQQQCSFLKSLSTRAILHKLSLTHVAALPLPPSPTSPPRVTPGLGAHAYSHSMCLW